MMTPRHLGSVDDSSMRHYLNLTECTMIINRLTPYREAAAMQEIKQSGRILRIKVIALALLVLLSVVMASDPALARRGSGDRDRVRFTGIIQKMPSHGLHGVWVIGGRRIMTNRHTQFDQREGRLRVGRCAKVDIRNGRLHEIDSEPRRNCR
jgi:hypothetical protein